MVLPLLSMLLLSGSLLAETAAQTTSELYPPIPPPLQKFEQPAANKPQLPRPDKIIFWTLQRLELSDQQRLEIEKARIEMRFAIRALKREVEAAKIKATELPTTIDFNKAAYIRQKVAACEAAAKIEAGFLEKMIHMLNRDQKEKLHELTAQQ